MPPSSDGWDQWKELVLDSLKDCKVMGERTTKELTDLRIAFEGFSKSMDVKASVWGALGGLIPALILLLVLVLKG